MLKKTFFYTQCEEQVKPNTENKKKIQNPFSSSVFIDPTIISKMAAFFAIS